MERDHANEMSPVGRTDTATGPASRSTRPDLGAGQRTERVAVIGGGSWGTAFAHLCSHNAPTALYARDSAVADSLNAVAENPRYLPGFNLHPDLCATSDIADAVTDATVVVMAVPSHGFRATLRQLRPHIGEQTPVVSLAKGLERGTRKRMTELVAEELPGRPAGVVTGPNLAKEILAGHAAAAVLAMAPAESATAARLRVTFSAPHFRVYTNNDVIGAEIGGATKNVMALAAGIADGLGSGDNTRATLITRGLAEVTRLGVAMGGDPLTFAGLAGVGDLVATCVSDQSRNRQVGLRLGRGEPLAAIIASMDQVAEGVKTVPEVVALANSLGVEMPIAEEVRAVVQDGRAAADAYRELLARPPAPEYRAHAPGPA